MSVTSDTDPVLYEVRDTGVAVLTLNRPERMNGWGGGLATASTSVSTMRRPIPLSGPSWLRARDEPSVPVRTWAA